MNTRLTNEEIEYQKYFYPGTEVLVNKKGIINPEQAEALERRMSSMRIKELYRKQKVIPVNYESFKAIHGYIFQDVWSWAGKIRTYTTGRGPIPFATPENIDPEMMKRFAKINQENNCQGLSLDKFAERAAEHIAEINAVHPFVEGNGRTQRLFLHYLAKQAGYKLNLRGIEQEKGDWYKASAISFNQLNYQPMAECIKKAITPLKVQQDKNPETAQEKYALPLVKEVKKRTR